MMRTKSLTGTKKPTMSARAYILIRTMEGKCHNVAQILLGMPGVMMVDVVEGPPDVVMVVEATERQKLAELTIRAIGSVEAMTVDVSLLPSQY